MKSLDRLARRLLRIAYRESSIAFGRKGLYLRSKWRIRGMRTRTLLSLALLAVVTMPLAAQRSQTYEALTVADTAVPITAATLSGMGACRGVVETAEIRFRGDGTAPTSSVGTPMGVGASIDFPNIIDARAARFIRTTGTSGVLHVNCWQIPQ